MKNSVKKISLIMAALTCASAVATTASAGGIFLNEPEKKSKTVVEETEEKPETTAENESAKGSAIFAGENKIYKTHPKSTEVIRPGQIIKAGKENNKDHYEIISGGKYYSAEAAKKELIEYFRANCSDVFLLKGETKAVFAGAYYYSDDSDVVVYNEKTGCLEAVGYGTASVYVYTKGGVPFYRFDVTVGKNCVPEKLTVEAEYNYIMIGESIAFTVKDENGKAADDVKLSIVSGAERAFISSKTGKLTALKNGPVVVRAESKYDSSVYGECLIYIGYRNSVSADNWFDCDGGIKVDKWFGDICTGITKPSGWIKCADGMFIPVLKLEDAPVVQPDGTVKDETVLYQDTVNIFEYFKNAYDIKSDYIEILKKYNLIKYGVDFDYDKLTWFDIDYKNHALSLLLKDILG